MSNDATCSGVNAASGSAALPRASVPADEAPRLLHASAAGTRNGRRRLLVGVIVCAVILTAVVISGRLLDGAAVRVDFSAKNLAPGVSHIFGTDWMGRDMLSRTLAGLSTSVLVGLFSAVVSSVIALVLASVAALGGDRADAAVEWLIDLVMGIPHIVLLILISYALGRGFWGVTVGVAVTHWPSLTRVLRAEILQVERQPFIASSRALGVSRSQIARDHMLPAVIPQYLVGLVLLFPHAILHEASITFLGFGLSPEQPAIGVILSEAMTYLTSGAWWLAVFPGIALLLVVLLFDRLGGLVRRLLIPGEVQL